MAIDANVLVFERAREEYAAYPSAGLRRALAVGFNKAWSRDHRLQRHHPARRRPAVLPRLRPDQGLRCHAVHRCHRLDDLGADHRPRALRPRRLQQAGRRAARRSAASATSARSARWLDRSRLRHHGQAPHVARHLRRRAGARRDRHRHPGPQPRRRVHRRSPARLLGLARTISVDEAREAVADAGFPEAVVQSADTADFTVRTGEITNDEEQQIEDALGAVGGTVDEDRRPDASAPRSASELRNKALIAFGVALPRPAALPRDPLQVDLRRRRGARDGARRDARRRPLRLAARSRSTASSWPRR